MSDPRGYVRVIALLGVVLLGLALGSTAYQAVLNVELVDGCSSTYVDLSDDPAYQACLTRQYLSWVVGDLARPLLVGALLSGVALLVVLARLRARQAGAATR